MALSPPTGSRTRFVVLVLASATLVVVGLRDVPLVRDLREGASTVIDPVDRVVTAATSPFRNAWHGVTDYEDVKRENDRLSERLSRVEAAGIGRSDAEQQFADLSAALDLPFAGDLPTVTARVVSGPRSNFSHTLEIDKGSDDGLAVGMPAAAGGGLVGRVTQVTAGTARIGLVTDPEFRLGVRLAEGGELGTARGQGRGEPLAVDTSINPRTEIAEGTGVVTSGVDRSAYPPGIPVGKVTGVREGSGGLALELEVAPLVDAEHLSYVTVLQWQPE